MIEKLLESIIEKHLAGAQFDNGVIAEIKNATPEELVSSDALAKAIEERDLIKTQFARELIETGNNSDTSKIYLGEASQLVMAIAAHVPQEERNKHIGDSDVAVADKAARIIAAQERMQDATATGLGKPQGHETIRA